MEQFLERLNAAFTILSAARNFSLMCLSSTGLAYVKFLGLKSGAKKKMSKCRVQCIYLTKLQRFPY